VDLNLRTSEIQFVSYYLISLQYALCHITPYRHLQRLLYSALLSVWCAYRVESQSAHLCEIVCEQKVLRGYPRTGCNNMRQDVIGELMRFFIMEWNFLLKGK
jgi:hypothetical protein